MWANWVHKPCCLAGPQRSQKRKVGYITTAVQRVTNRKRFQKWRAYFSLSWMPKRGQNGCITPAILQVPKQGTE